MNWNFGVSSGPPNQAAASSDRRRARWPRRRTRGWPLASAHSWRQTCCSPFRLPFKSALDLPIIRRSMRTLICGVAVCILTITGVLPRTRPAPSKARSPTRPPARVPGARIVASNVDTGLTRKRRPRRTGSTWSPVPASSAATASPIRAAIRDAGAGSHPGQREPDGPGNQRAAGRAIGDPDRHGRRRRAAGRDLRQRARAGRVRPRAGRPAPLNGWSNFTQLGLLQTGVAPLTAGLTTAGGSLRQGQAYAVNGMRPEQNMYRVDGAQNVNRMDGGYALKLPVEAIAEFRISRRAPRPRTGGTGGATTSAATRSGAATSFTPASTSSCATTPSTRGISSRPRSSRSSRTSSAPRPAARSSRTGCCSSATTKGSGTSRARRPPRRCRRRRSGPAIFPEWGRRSSTSRPAACRSRNEIPPPRSIRCRGIVLNMYPLGNVSPSIYRVTLVGTNVVHSTGGRVTSTRRRTTSSLPVIPIPAVITSTRSRCAAPTRRAFRRATICRRMLAMPPRTRASSRRC